MTPHRCAMPDCQRDATGIFCPHHYFLLPAKDAKWLVRLQIMIARSDDAEMKGHLREQLHGYTQQAIRTLQNAEALSPPYSASAVARPIPREAPVTSARVPGPISIARS